MTNLHILPNRQHDTANMIELYRDLDRQIKSLTKEKDAIGKELKSGYFLDNDDFIQDGRLLATYRPQLRVSLDQSRLKEELPDVVKAYQKIETVRVFLLK